MTEDEMRDAARWAALMFLHPVDIATIAMGAKDGPEMLAQLAIRADRFIDRAKAAYSSREPQHCEGSKDG